MSKTWSKTRNDPNTRTDALAARRVLRDCYRSFEELKKAPDGAPWRLRWLTTITLLRTVGHVLDRIDSKRSRFLATAIKDAYRRWKDNPLAHLIFHDFIKRERDMALKEYKMEETVVFSPTAEDAPSIRRPMLIGFTVVGQVQAVRDGIRWWEGQLDYIEEDARANLRADKMSAVLRSRTRIKRRRRQG